MEKEFYVRTVMEICIVAENASEAKYKAIKTFHKLENWVPITPLAVTDGNIRDLGLLQVMKRKIIEMERNYRNY